MVKRKRKNQEERSRHTQALITQATIECILEKGIRATSTVDVARKAGVSRGALVHHFSSKASLMQSALEELLNREVENVKNMAESLRSGELNFENLLKELHDHFRGDMFMVTLEYLTNARTDPDIMDVLVPLAGEFNSSLEMIWDQVVASSNNSSHQNRVALNATLCMMRGMGAQSIWRNDPALYRDMLLFWKQALLDLGFVAPNYSRGEPL